MKAFSILLISLVLLGCFSKSKNTVIKSSSKNYKLVYNVLYNDETDNYEVFAMDINGNNKTNLSNWKGVDWVYYTWKDKIYFVSDRDTTHRKYFLYEMDIKGENIRKVADFRLDDSWLGSRKNGSELIINPHKSVDSTSFLIIDQYGKIIQKVPSPLPTFSDPAFTPDGKHIVFRGGTKKSKREPGYQEELFLMDDSGNNLKQLTQYPKADTTAEWYAFKAGVPVWNVRENFISYQSKQNGKYSLFAVTPDGARQWKLTSNPQEEGWHDWSSDGNWLAIELFDKEQKQFHIGLMNWNTKAINILTDTIYKYQQAPSFVETSNKE